MQSRLYHMGFRSEVRRNTLANANEQRDWRIYADVAQVLIRRARELYAHEAMDVDLEETVYALDSTTIDLCLSLFPWAPYERSKAAVKMHTLLDVRGSIPSFVLMTPGRISDVSVLDQLALEAGSFYVMDRGYIHFARLYRFVLAAAFFVVRARVNMRYRRRYSTPVDKKTGLRCDQTIVLTGQDSSRDYPVPARQIHYFDAEHDLRLEHSDKSFRAAGSDSHATLQGSLERGTILQMDQAASPRQAVLRHLPQCRQNPTLDCADRLSAGADPQEATQPGGQPLQNPTNFEHDTV